MEAGERAFHLIDRFGPPPLEDQVMIGGFVASR